MTEMKIFLAMCVTVLLLLFWIPSSSSNSQEVKSPGVRLQNAGKVQMLQLRQGDPRPFFRVDLNIVNALDGSPAEVELPEKINLKDLIEIQTGNNKPFHPFYVSKSEANTANAPVREILMLIDTSGSMNTRLPGVGQNRFAAAKDAARGLLKDFRDKVDYISIAKFDSHDVVSTIEAAEFVNTKARAESQIDALPPPNGNTALYSATEAALKRLEERKRANPSRQFLLVVLTDGKNDVGHPKDDQLLLGENGLEIVMKKADEVGIPIYTIGLGESGTDFDARVLEEMAYPRNSKNYFQARNMQQLQEKIRVVQQLSVDSFRIAFFSETHPDRRNLKNITFSVSLNLPSTSPIKSENLSWSCTASSGCPPAGDLTPEENRARFNSNIDSTPHVNPWMRLLLIFALLSGGITFFWFIPPRLMWPLHGLPRMSGYGVASKVPQIPPKLRESVPPPKSQAFERGGQKNVPPEPRKRLDQTMIIKRDRRDI